MFQVYGAMLKNELKHTICKYAYNEIEQLTLIGDPLLVSTTELGGGMMEATLKKRSIIQKSPISVGCAVLFISKTIMMRFYSDFILKHINKRSVCAAYVDTGKYCILCLIIRDQEIFSDCWKMALAEDSLEKCVSPEQKSSFLKDAKEFLVDETSKETILATKIPGRFAVESVADVMIALNPKSYFETSEDHNFPTKISCKGVSKKQNSRLLTRQAYTEALFGDQPKKIINTGFLRKKSEMVTYQMLRNGLHAGFYKRAMHDCFIHSFVYPWL